MSDEFKPLTVGDLVDCLSEFPRDVPLWKHDFHFDEDVRYCGGPIFIDEDGVREVWI